MDCYYRLIRHSLICPDICLNLIKVFRSIIQMMDKQRILCLFVLLVMTSCQLSGPEGHCLGYCANCDPYALSSCRGESPCLWGFYSSQTNDQCHILPSLQIVSEELGERSDTTIVPYFTGWGGEAKLSKCEYLSIGHKKTVDVLGLFEGSISVEKEFQVPVGAEILELSFSLLRDEWLPLNDFLMIEIADHASTLQMFQVSYQTRSGPNPQNVNITCDRKHVKVQKFRIRINKTLKADKIRVIFSSFLFDAGWGLTNVKLIAGCSAFSQWDKKTGTCQQCQTGSYFFESYRGFGECKTCPSLCKTCKDEQTCLSCSWGSLINGKCTVSSTYKTQTINLPSEASICRSRSILINNITKKITLPMIRNQKNNLYDEMVLSLTVYYDPYESEETGKVSIGANGQIVMTAGLDKNNTFTDQCELFASGRTARVSIVGQPIPINDNGVIVTVEAEGVKTFGVADVVMYSINKGSLGQEQKTIDNNTQVKIKQSVPSNSQNSEKEVPVKGDIPLENNVVPEESNVVPQKDSVVPVEVKKSSSEGKTQNNPQVQTLPKEAPLKVSSGDEHQTNDKTVPATNPVPIVPDSTLPALSETSSYSTSSSGLFSLSVKNLSEPITGLLLVEINQLLPTQYQLIENYYSEEDLIVVIKILKSFREGVIIIKELQEGRLLQAGQTQLVARVSVSRFDAYENGEISNVQAFAGVFSVFAWVGLVAIVLSVLTGFGVVSQNYVITLQVLFLHVFIGYDVMPLSFRDVLGGLRGLGFLNYFATRSTTTGISMTPEARFWLIPAEFNFILAFLPILASLALYGLWFGLLVSLKKWVFPRSIPDDSRTRLHVLADGIVCRTINFIDSIWRYQLVAVILICLFEFVGAHHGGNSGQTVFAGIVLFMNVGWLVFSQIYIRNQYYQNEYSEFIYQFQDRYYCKIPLHSLPSRHHRLGYPLMRVAKVFIIVLVVTLISQPLLSVLLIFAVNAFQLWYIHFNSIYSDTNMLKFKAIQSLLFLFIQFFMFVMMVSKSSLSSSTFKNWGFFLSATAILIIINSIVRSGYIVRSKYIQMKGVNFEQVDIDQKKLQTERAV